MSLLDVVRSAVKVADTITKPLQGTVTYRRTLTSTDGYGSIATTDVTTLRATIDRTTHQVRTREGIVVPARVKLIFLDIAALVDATGGAGIAVADVFILPDGSTGPILHLGGFIDAGTGQPFATEVSLG